MKLEYLPTWEAVEEIRSSWAHTPASTLQMKADAKIPTSHVLSIYRHSATSRNLTIRDSETAIPLYAVQVKYLGLFTFRKGRIIIRRAPSPSFPAKAEAPVARASVHVFPHHGIDLHFGSYSVTLRPTRYTSSIWPYRFESSMGPLRWWRDEHLYRCLFLLKLLDTKGHTVARFRNPTKGRSLMWGAIEIARGVEGGQRLLDEIVTSGVALVEQLRE